jgi:opacity protein-like surface antigen
MFNAGIGLSYKITPSWFVRTDGRIFHSTNSDFNDNALTLTLGYRFNGGEKAD